MPNYLVSFCDYDDIEVLADDETEAATRAIEKITSETNEEVNFSIMIEVKRSKNDSNPWYISSVPVLANAGFYKESQAMAKYIEDEIASV